MKAKPRSFFFQNTLTSWQIVGKKKFNLILFIGFLNVLAGAVVFPLLNIYHFQTELIATMLAVPIIWFVNERLNFIVAAYLFSFVTNVLMFFVSVKMGVDSYIILFLFPILFATVSLLGKKETFVHMVIIIFSFLICIIAILIGYTYDFLLVEFDATRTANLKYFNICLGSTSTLSFILILTHESIKQDTIIKSMLKEKEVLLAEVYHRVKNNMNIVNSLLNLKKNASESSEVKEVLEACRNRVFSMSLIHEKFFRQKDVTSIDFNLYAEELIKEISQSFGDMSKTVEFNSDKIELSISQAIPCGLILNELLTNAFKHSKPVDGELKITVELRKKERFISMIITDNGQGFDMTSERKNDSMGLDLIKSLCEQIDAEWSVETKNGILFRIEFEIEN